MTYYTISASPIAMPYSDFVASRTKSAHSIFMGIDDRKIQTMHGVWGIVGELQELAVHSSTTNLIEELGDILFYTQILQTEFQDQLAELDPKRETQTQRSIYAIAYDMMDHAKKFVIHGNESKVPLIVEALADFMLALSGYVGRKEIGLTVEQLQLLNQHKLTVRYPDGYSDAAAAARADKPAGE